MIYYTKSLFSSLCHSQIDLCLTAVVHSTQTSEMNEFGDLGEGLVTVIGPDPVP
jgi:hypothetical protein